MTKPILKPGRKNPQIRTVHPTLPPAYRSRKALGFTVAAAEGRFCLQRCDDCGKLTYPAREACPACLSMNLRWQDVDPAGQLIAETTIRTSTNSYFRERTPWRTGTVMLDAGVSVLAHIHGDVTPQGRVRMIARTDKSGKGVMMALPEKEVENMADDKQLRELTCDPKHRRVLITDGRSDVGQAMARAMVNAGAEIVFVGLAEEWRGFPGQAAMTEIANVEIVPLDVTNTTSVQECAGEIGGKVDILINTAQHTRPGGIMGRRDVVTSRDEMEVNYFGLMRLMQGFGPGMKARGADGVNSACAWVNLLSVYALSNKPDFGSTSASQAAALSLAQCFRAEMAGSGVKVVNAYHGPLEDEWHQPLPPPKVSPNRLAREVTGALQQGLEDIAIGEVAVDVRGRWQEDAGVLEKELTQIEGM
ncbi:MAG: SDR family NAD(P)-dependent oxidoreductase [Rhodobacteraceae bacterium]|nr:SDR family NAD(P)-dependent oxidoreductase [Paracoccaceae bacterium]